MNTEYAKNTDRDYVSVYRQLNSYLFKRSFAHHPDCDRYDHHVLKFNGWAFCIGDTALYSTILMLMVLKLIGVDILFNLNQTLKFTVGIIFFLPAIFQLRWKSKRKIIKFMMRQSLGVSIFYLLYFTFSFNDLNLVALNLTIFVVTAYVYSKYNSKKHLVECINCAYGETYRTCLIRHQKILEIPDIEILVPRSNTVAEIIQLRDFRHEN